MPDDEVKERLKLHEELQRQQISDKEISSGPVLSNEKPTIAFILA